jgi:methionine sulfoxide reductase heme-binding subunit
VEGRSVILWEVTRASAFVAFACYTVAVVWGIALTARSFSPPVSPQFDYHRFVSVLGLLALITHVSTLLADRFAHVGVGTLLGLGPSWGVRAGVAAFWLTIAIPLSFRLKQRKWLSQRFWRRFHYLGYAVWALALVHGLWVGTDTGSRYALVAYAASAAVVAGTAWWRWFEVAPKAARSARTAGAEAKRPVAVARPEVEPERQVA